MTYCRPASNNLKYKWHKLKCWRSVANSAKEANYQDDNTDTKPGKKRRFSPLADFFIVLVRLRVGLLAKDLAKRFSTSEASISRIFKTWINFLSLELLLVFPWPTQEAGRMNKPHAFWKFPTTRVILDCTEIISIQIPSSLLAQSER